MSEVIEKLLERIDQRKLEMGWTSDRSLSIAATGKDNLMRDLRRKNGLPNTKNMIALADTLEATVEWLMGKAENNEALKSEVSIREIPLKYKTQPPRSDLPVVGTAHGGTVIYADSKGSDADIEQTQFEPTQTIRYVTRPMALYGAKDAYAVYVEGDSMDPKFEPGDMAIVDPRQRAQIRDYVIVQLSENGHDEISAILIKRLVRRSASFIELEQFNPPITFRVDAARVKHLHRIMPNADLLGG